MSDLRYRRRGFARAGLALIALLSACAIERSPTAGDCVQGRAVPCTCDDGSLGASTCAADGVFSACACAALSSGGQGGVVAPPIAGSAGIGTGGASGSSGQGVAAGDEALPIVDAGGSGEDASVGAPPSGDGGVDASTGMDGDGAVVAPPEPKPGEAYGPCRADGSCDASLFCTFDTSAGGAATYCTMFCSVSGLGAMCPARRDGAPGTCLANVCLR